MSAPGDPTLDQRLQEAVASLRADAAEQVSAAWRMQADLVQELLRRGWEESVARVFQERFAFLETQVQERCQAALRAQVEGERAGLVERARQQGRREVASTLHQIVRRLSEATSYGEWAQALLSGVAGSCERAALFTVVGNNISCEAATGAQNEATVRRLQVGAIPLSQAPAFQTALETKEPVVSLRSEQELSAAVMGLFPESPSAKVSLLPLVRRGAVAAVLYAEGDERQMDFNTLELVGLLGAATLQPARTPVTGPLTQLTVPAPLQPEPTAVAPDQWEKHLRAQRFARVKVAEWLLGRMPAVQVGRHDRSLYAALRAEIETARQGYRQEFMKEPGLQTDYLHQEMVRSLAQNDAAMLGSEYPGPLA